MPNGIDNGKEHAAYHIPIGEREPHIERLSYEELELIYGKEEVTPTPLYYRTVADLEYRPNPETNIAFEPGVLFNYAEHLDYARKEYVKSGQLKLTSPDVPFFNNLVVKFFGEDLKSRIVDPLFGIYQPIEERDLINQESTIGSGLFGAQRPNETIKFYNLDLNNWYFYQEIIDASNKPQSTTIHYEVSPEMVSRSKMESDKLFEPLVGEELGNFMLATQMYHERTMKQIYGRDPMTGKKLQ